MSNNINIPLSDRSILIKSLINEEVCMGTYGLVELELKEFDKEIAELKKIIKFYKENNDQV
jgi:hypothetical protein